MRKITNIKKSFHNFQLEQNETCKLQPRYFRKGGQCPKMNLVPDWQVREGFYLIKPMEGILPGFT